MNDNENPAQPSGQPGPTPPTLRDRVLGIRAVVAVALASLVLGGAGGAALGAVSSGSDDGGRGGFGGRGGPGGNPPGTTQQFPAPEGRPSHP